MTVQETGEMRGGNPESDQLVNLVVRINASAGVVWNLLTDPLLMKQWMAETDLDIELETEVGKPVVIKGILHHEPFESKGTVLQCEPGKLFQYTSLNSLSKLIDEPGNYSVITFGLTPSDTGTDLSFSQRHFPGEASFEHSRFYWQSALYVLKQLAENSPTR